MSAQPVPDDVTLLSAAAQGEPDAVRNLIDGVGAVVYGFIFARVGGDPQAAEDLLQETMIESMRSAHTFRGDAKLQTWICTIARRRIARHWERERKHELARSGLQAVEEPVEVRDDVEERDEVVRALAGLPASHRQVLVMKYMDDLSVAEIATQMGRTKVQVQSLLQRARDGLRRRMEAPDA